MEVPLILTIISILKNRDEKLYLEANTPSIPIYKGAVELAFWCLCGKLIVDIEQIGFNCEDAILLF
jgi:hypothetical protein